MKTFFILPFFCFLFLFSCQKDDVCAEKKIPRMHVALRKSLDSSIYTETQLNVVGENRDSVIPLERGKLMLPLRLVGGSTVYVFTLGGFQDTLKVSYETDLEWVSKGCGFRVIYKDIQVIDTPYLSTDRRQKILNLENATIKNEQDVHIRIYF